MKQSRLFMPTLREVPRETDLMSHQVLLRGGYIRQVSSGIFSYLPLANLVINNLKGIVREEFARIDANEMLLPTLIPKALLMESGRYEDYQETLFEVTDNENRSFILGYSHEELFLSAIKDEIISYKKLPLILYQIKDKYRNELKIRQGIIRTKEFLMCDAGSFHLEEADLDKMYLQFERTFERIFERCGLKSYAVVGKKNLLFQAESKEFMVFSESGDQTVVYSDGSDYVSSYELAKSILDDKKEHKKLLPLEKVTAPEFETIEEIAKHFKLKSDRIIKTILVEVDDELVLILLRGTDELSLAKAQTVLNAKNIRIASMDNIEKSFAKEFDALNPIGCNPDVKVIADHRMENAVNLTCRGCMPGVYYQNVNSERDYGISEFADLRLVCEGEQSPDGNGILHFSKAYELGHIFKFGAQLSELLNADVPNSEGQSVPILMGSYRLGISRLLAMIADASAKETGLNWPMEVAPFDIHIIPINVNDDIQMDLALALEQEFEAAGYACLIDDRNERAGVKFKDADFVGSPYWVTVGQKAEEGIVDVKIKKSDDILEVRREDLLETLKILNH